MLFQGRNNQPLFVSELFRNHMAVIAFRIFGRSSNVFLQFGILEKDNKQTVVTVQLLQLSQLTVHTGYTGEICI